MELYERDRAGAGAEVRKDAGRAGVGGNAYTGFAGDEREGGSVKGGRD